MEQLKRFLTEELKINDDRIINEFVLYNDLIFEWNKKINLISRKQESIEKNLLDSIYFLTKHKLKGNEHIIDVGTGGGFPGIPLKILYPELKLTLLDSTQKKINAVNDIILKMNFENTIAIWGRAEDKSKESEFINRFDAVITLAVSTLDNIYKWCKGFLNKDGYIISLKGGDMTGEIKKLKNLNSDIDIQTLEFKFDNYPGLLTDKKAVILKI